MRQAALACMIGMGALLAISQGVVMAQTLTGQVTSAQQGPMEGVLISAKREASTITTTVVTDHKGRYSFPEGRIVPGRYALSVRAVGFDLAGANRVEISSDPAALDITLAPTKDLAAQLTNSEWLIRKTTCSSPILAAKPLAGSMPRPQR